MRGDGEGEVDGAGKYVPAMIVLYVAIALIFTHAYFAEVKAVRKIKGAGKPKVLATVTALVILTSGAWVLKGADGAGLTGVLLTSAGFQSTIAGGSYIVTHRACGLRLHHHPGLVVLR